MKDRHGRHISRWRARKLERAAESARDSGDSRAYKQQTQRLFGWRAAQKAVKDLLK